MTVAADRLAQERRRWALPGSRWDRFVVRAKLALPFLAGGVLLACLIWPLTARQEFSFILSKESVAMAGERLRMERPLYRGEDSEGRSFSILAESAVQRTSSTPVVELKDIRAQLAMQQGVATVTAPMGRYDMEGEQLRVSGPVVFTRPDGYTLRTSDVVVDLPSRVATTDDGVTGSVPLGTFSADHLKADVESHVLTLSGHVNMRITQL
jgi:lipopolysaccharide export system protein LptC